MSQNPSGSPPQMSAAPESDQLQSCAEGGTNGKHICSSRAFEEGTEKSTAGSPTVYCGTSGFGKLKLERASYIVSLGSKADQSRTEKAMGKDPKGIEARSDRLNACEANDLGSRKEEDRGGTAGAVGEDEGGEEGGLMTTEPAPGLRQALVFVSG